MGGTRSEAGTPGNELIKKPMEPPLSSLRVRRAGVAAAAAARSRGTRSCLVNHQQICDLIASQGKSPSVKALTHLDFISFSAPGTATTTISFLFFLQLNSQIFAITSLQRCFSASVRACVSIPPSRAAACARPRVHGTTSTLLLAFPARHSRALGSPRSSLLPRSAAPRT